MHIFEVLLQDVGNMPKQENKQLCNVMSVLNVSLLV